MFFYTELLFKMKLAFIYDCEEWSHNHYQPLVTKHISNVSKDSLKSLRRLTYLSRCFRATNHRSVSSNSSKIELRSFTRASL